MREGFSEISGLVLLLWALGSICPKKKKKRKYLPAIKKICVKCLLFPATPPNEL